MVAWCGFNLWVFLRLHFSFLIVQHRGEPLLKPPDFYKRLAILCTFLSLHEMRSSPGSCTFGRLLWCWSHSNLFFHRLARILHTTVVGCFSVANSFSTHKRCRRKTALKHIRWSVAVIFGEPAVALYVLQMYGQAPFLLVLFVWRDLLELELGEQARVGVQRSAGLNRAIITERKRSSSGA